MPGRARSRCLLGAMAALALSVGPALAQPPPQSPPSAREQAIAAAALELGDCFFFHGPADGTPAEVRFRYRRARDGRVSLALGRTAALAGELRLCVVGTAYRLLEPVLVGRAGEIRVPVRLAASAPEPRDEEPGTLPATLSGDVVLDRLLAVAPDVSLCGPTHPEPVRFALVVDPSGRVTSAAPVDRPAGSPGAACVERALRRRARFPRFSGPAIHVTHAFRLAGP